MDVFSRRVVGRAMRARQRAGLVQVYRVTLFQHSILRLFWRQQEAFSHIGLLLPEQICAHGCLKGW